MPTASLPKKCLVVGGDSFVGSHLVDALVARGHEVRVFDAFPMGNIKNLAHLQGKIAFVKGQFSDRDRLRRALDGIDTVFHFTALTTPVSTAYDPTKEIRINLEGTLQLLCLCVEQGVQKIVFHSSGGTVYGNALDEVASETTQMRPLSPYAVTKLTIEEYLHLYRRQYGLDFVIYRIANPYGERQDAEEAQGVIPIFMKQMIRNETLSIYGNTVRDYIYVKDATLFIAENFDQRHKHSTYNIGSGKGVALFELILMIAKTTQSAPKIKRRERRPFDVQKIVLDIARVNEEFGFYPMTSLEVGLEKTYAYLKEKYAHDPLARKPWLDMGLAKFLKWDRLM